MTEHQALVLDDLLTHQAELQAMRDGMQAAFVSPFSLHGDWEVVEFALAARLGADRNRAVTIDGSVTPNAPAMAMAGGSAASAGETVVKSWIRQNEATKQFFNSLPRQVKKELSELFLEVKADSSGRGIFVASLALLLARRLIGFERIEEKLDAGNFKRIGEYQIYLEEARELAENLTPLLNAGFLSVAELFPSDLEEGFNNFIDRMEDVEVRIVGAIEALAEGEEGGVAAIKAAEAPPVDLASLKQGISYVFFAGNGICRYLGQKEMTIGGHTVTMMELKQVETGLKLSVPLSGASKLRLLTEEELVAADLL
ncbi:MAG: hypothetical protein Q7S68_05505 [Deltaproteobacteria bacterium]|nr:hypothetical protein [Deltaproteobacteria bacterium]